MKRDCADVYLLGAGFARAIAPAMPLLQDLAEHVAGDLDAAGRIPPEVAAMMRQNFAHALSYLEQPRRQVCSISRKAMWPSIKCRIS